MKLLLIFDNPKGGIPSGWVLTEALNFYEFLSRKTEVDVVILSQNNFYGLEMEPNRTVGKKEIPVETFDGVIISMTKPTVHNLLINEKLKEKLLSMLNEMKNDATLIFCAGIEPIERIKTSNMFISYNVVYQRKIGIKWFNYHLKETVQKIFF